MPGLRTSFGQQIGAPLAGAEMLAQQPRAARGGTGTAASARTGAAATGRKTPRGRGWVNCLLSPLTELEAIIKLLFLG